MTDFEKGDVMSRKKKDMSQKRNPSRNIKIHNRDELLRRVMDERNGKKRSDDDGKRREIRDRVYAGRPSSRGRNTGRKENETNDVKKKKSGLGAHSPKLNGFFLPKKTAAGRGKIDKNKLEERRMATTAAVLIALVLFISVVVYMVNFAVKYMQRSVPANDTVTYGSIDSAKICSGVIVRDEVLYNSPADGEAVFNIADNDKVKANTDICSVQDVAAVENLQSELDVINQKIIDAQKTRESVSAVTEEVKRCNRQIKASADNYAFRLAGGDVSTLYSMRGDLEKLIDNRNQRLISENAGSLSGLANERAQQLDKINNSKSVVKSNEAGVVSCYSDGLESKYTFENMGELTQKDTDINVTASVLGKNVSQGDPLFKIVRSNDWYIVSYIPNNLIEEWTVGDTVNIYIRNKAEDQRKVEMQIASLNTGEKNSLVILKSTKYLTDYISVRSVSFETSKAMTGFKIPNNATVEQTMLKISSNFVVNNKIYKKTEGDTVIEMDVVPAGTNVEEGMTYIPFDINRLNVGETLVLPENKEKTFTIKDVVTAKGVFVMNTGIAEFTKINLENSASNANYTVLDPGVNTNIRLYDRIVTDTKNIEKQQKLIS